MSPFSKVNVRRDDSSVSEFEAPLRLRSGATTDLGKLPKAFAVVCIPGAWIPSSLLSNIRIVTRCIDKLPDHAGGEAARRQPETQFNGYVIPPVPAELLWIEKHRPARRLDFLPYQQRLQRGFLGDRGLLESGASRWLPQSPLPGSVAVIISSRLCTRACETSSSSGVTTNQLPRPANCSASPSTT